jgi:hypothetical protein
LVPSQQPLPGCAWSAAEVVRRLYGWCAEQQQSCQQIADELNRLHIPAVVWRRMDIHARGGALPACGGRPMCAI